MKTTYPLLGIATISLFSFTPADAATLSLGTAVPSAGAGVQNLASATSTADATSVQFVDSDFVVGDNGAALGQAFTAGANEGGYLLSSISVKQVAGFSTTWDFTGGSVTLQIFQLGTTTGNGVWNITQLALETATAGGEPDGLGFSSGTQGAGAMWLTITLSTPIALAANGQYGFQMMASGTNADDGFFMELDGTNTNPYAAGFATGTSKVEGQPDSALLWDGGNGRPSDRVFVATMTAVPEPSGAALFGTIGILSLLRRRRTAAH